MKKIAIIGAGYLGRGCAQLFLNAGYQVMISNSRDKNSLSSVVSGIVGCQIGTTEEAVDFSDIVLIAIPFTQITALTADAFSKKIVIDANNYYPERDGQIEVLDTHQITTSELVAKHLRDAYVVKAFNAILAADLVKDARPKNDQNRRALPIAGDHADAKAEIIRLYDDVGYDAVDAGKLADSWRFERAKPAYCIALNKAELAAALQAAQRDKEVAHGSWRHN